MGALSVEDYLNYLYTSDMEGYVEITQNFNTHKYANVNNLKNVLKEFEGLENIYITPNTFYKKSRRVDNIRHFRALFIDMDISSSKQNISKQEIVYKVFILALEGAIPEPSLVVDSGRGIHLYWKIEHAPYGALWTWQNLQDYLYSQLKNLGADKGALDGARLLRLPGTVNQKNGSICKVLHINNEIIYSMYDLRDEYLDYSKKKKRRSNKKNRKNHGKKIFRIFNSYTLYMTRMQDIETLCRLRDWDMRDYRNNIIHYWIYLKGITVRDTDDLLRVSLEFNQKFLEPQKTSEINATVRSCKRAVEKYLEYENSSDGYSYRNDTLIELFDISEKEQKHLKTIIGKKEKYSRNNTKRRELRRDEDGLTAREKQKQETINSVLDLHKENLMQVDIAKKLNLSKSTVSKIVNNKY